MGLNKKLHSRRGETLTETLAAILVIGLISGAVAAMIGTAARMNRTAREQDRQFYEAVSLLESPSGTSSTGAVKATLGSKTHTYSADLYQDAAGKLTTYRVK